MFWKRKPKPIPRQALIASDDLHSVEISGGEFYIRTWNRDGGFSSWYSKSIPLWIIGDLVSSSTANEIHKTRTEMRFGRTSRA